MGRVVAGISERLPQFGYHTTVLARRVSPQGLPYPTNYYRPQHITHYRPVPGVDVYAIPPCSGLGERIQPRCESLYADQPSDCIVNWDCVFTTLNYILDYNPTLRRKFFDLESTLVHGHDWFGAQFIYNLKTARKLPDLKTVLSVHMSSERDEEMLKRDERLQWEHKGCKLADRVHAVSGYQARLIKERYRLRQEKVICIPNAIDLDYFRPATAEEKRSDELIVRRYGLEPQAYVMFWGRIDPAKGISQLIRAWGQLAPSRLQLAIFGLPADWEYYHSQVIREHHNLPAQLRQRVKIHVEKLRGHELVSLIRSAYVAVFPSVREAFGLVAIEAQACGIPVVVGRAGGLPENVMEKKTGITVEGAEPSSIAAGLEYVIANRQRLAERTREFAQNYSWGRIARRYVNELYTL